MTKRLVAIVDIIGYSELVCKVPCSEVMREFELRVRGWFKKHLDKTFIHFASFPYADLRNELFVELNFINFSDTFLIYTPDTSLASFISITTACAGMIFCCLSQGYPLRGAITSGDLCVSEDQSLYIGEALIQAHTLEKKQEWCGAILDKRLCQNPEYPDTVSHFIKVGLLVKYNVPSKKDDLNDYLAIGWPKPWSNGNFDYNQYIWNWLPIITRGAKPRAENDAQKKKENTERFCKYYRDRFETSTSST